MTETVSRLAVSLGDRYRIERELGQGGMATVYLARDLRHDRDVAMKVLHPDLVAALGSERFLSEIKTTARLQHPHILPLLDSGTADGLLYYVMPYMRGETLRARLDREHLLPIDDALRIAREVADALAYAHGLGIVHRDVKPENILLQGGHALVADFGIALAVQQAGGQRLTQTGLSLGTPQYMSPEQAMGEKAIDARTDIYALGAVTYEMLAGDPPFTGSSVQAIVAKVLAERPTPLHTMRDTVPLGVESAIFTALAKLPADRFATAEKFAEALTRTDVATPAPSQGVGARVAAPARTGPPVTMLAAVIGAIILTGPLAWWLGRRSAAPEPRWSAFTQLTDAAGIETSPSISPDGESFAYSTNAKGTWDIVVQRVGGRNPVVIAGDSTLDEVWPAYSPDGKHIAYGLRGGGLFVVGATGESARRLTTFGSYPAWSPDGRRIAFTTEEVDTPYNTVASGRLWVVDASGGEPSEIVLEIGARNFGAYEPAWSPSGARIAYWVNSAGQRDLETVSPAGRDRIKVTDDVALDWAPAWSPDGRFLYFASDRGGAMGLWRIAVDEKSGHPRGSPEPVASGVDVDMDLPHLSRDGSTLIFRSQMESVNPAAVAFDRATGRIGSTTLLQRRRGILTPSDVSPDGKWMALFNVPDRQQDVFLMRTDGSGLTRLTDDAARDWSPRFTPDGKAILFYSNAEGTFVAYSILLDGSGRTRLTDFADGVIYPMFAPDAKRLVVSLSSRPGGLIGTPPWPMTEKSATVLRTEVAGGTMRPTYWTRDGRRISGFIRNAAGEPNGFGVYDVATGRARRLNDDSRGYDLAWMPGSRSVVYFTDRGTLVMQDVESLARREIIGRLPYPPDLLASITASPDGKTLYYGARQVESNIWIVKRLVSAPARP